MTISIYPRMHRLELSNAEALVFYDLLDRLSRIDFPGLELAERTVLEYLASVISFQLVEPYLDDYPNRLRQARLDVGEDQGGHNPFPNREMYEVIS